MSDLSNTRYGKLVAVTDKMGSSCDVPGHEYMAAWSARKGHAIDNYPTVLGLLLDIILAGADMSKAMEDFNAAKKDPLGDASTPRDIYNSGVILQDKNFANAATYLKDVEGITHE